MNHTQEELTELTNWFEDNNIGGEIVQSYFFCTTQAWLILHGFQADQLNEFILSGKAEHLRKDAKYREVLIDHAMADFYDGTTVFEQKRTNHNKTGAIAQLRFYGTLIYAKTGTFPKLVLKDRNGKLVSKIECPDPYMFLQELKAKLISVNKPLPNRVMAHKCKNCSFATICYA